MQNLVRWTADGVVYYLPVFVPLGITLLSIIQRISDEWSGRQVLKIYNDLILGILSFVAWAIIRDAQVGVIDLNDDLVIEKGRFIFLVGVDVLLWAVATVVYRHNWSKKHERIIPVPFWEGRTVAWNPERREVAYDGLMVAATVCLFFLPIVLSSRRAPAAAPASHIHTVAIPYRDACGAFTSCRLDETVRFSEWCPGCGQMLNDRGMNQDDAVSETLPQAIKAVKALEGRSKPFEVLLEITAPEPGPPSMTRRG